MEDRIGHAAWPHRRGRSRPRALPQCRVSRVVQRRPHRSTRSATGISRIRPRRRRHSRLSRSRRVVPGLSHMLCRTITIDLFDPLQRERIRAEAVQLASQGLGPKAIAERIGERPTLTAVHRALKLDRTMKSLGLASPYVVITSPPDDYAKLRHYRSAKYAFTPEDGYEPPPLVSEHSLLSR